MTCHLKANIEMHQVNIFLTLHCNKKCLNYAWNGESFKLQSRLFCSDWDFLPDICQDWLLGAVQDLFKTSGQIQDKIPDKLSFFLFKPRSRLFSTSPSSLQTFFQTFLSLKYVSNNFTLSWSSLKFILQSPPGSTSLSHAGFSKHKSLLPQILHTYTLLPWNCCSS